MPTGLIALLDDVAGIARMAAASLDDVAAAAGKASGKAAGVVIDDTAVTPAYVTGLSPERELPIIAKIAAGSLRNKLLILLPIALLLSALAPWALTPLLMLGGTYLCFEGAEKLIEAVAGGHGGDEEDAAPTDAATLEKSKVAGAIRTDFILSGEIMTIALASVAGAPLWEQAVALIVVAIVITLGVYGVVGLIVKMDDIGLHLAQRRGAGTRRIGRALVLAMPVLMRWLSTIGTAAMLWVGGGILIHGLEGLGVPGPAHLLHAAGAAAGHAAPAIGGLLDWAVYAIGSAIAGVLVGGVMTALVHGVQRLRGH